MTLMPMREIIMATPQEIAFPEILITVQATAGDRPLAALLLSVECGRFYEKNECSCKEKTFFGKMRLHCLSKAEHDSSHT